MEKEIVYTQACNGKWLAVKEALFDRLPESETKLLLQRILLAANIPVVSDVPSHVIDVIADYSSVIEVTPHVVRIALKHAPACYKRLKRSEKLRLLQFCLRDCQFDDLCGLELLPLSDGVFETFSKSSDSIYISSLEHPKELLPGLDNRFLDQKVDAEIIRKLKEAAKQGRTLTLLLTKTRNNQGLGGAG